MRSWLPVPGTTVGKLVESALEEFGAHGYDAVSVGDLAGRAGVTTGSIYHHFGSKAGLWRLVRADVEQRVIDRVEGGASVRRVETAADLAPALLNAYDYLVAQRYAALMADPSTHSDDEGPDALAELIDRLLGAPPPIGFLLVAAWRAALSRADDGKEAAASARASLERLLLNSATMTARSAE